MREPDENELAGLERLVAWLKPKTCEDVTGKKCEAILSDECSPCIELSGAQEWLQEVILDVRKMNEGS